MKLLNTATIGIMALGLSACGSNTKEIRIDTNIPAQVYLGKERVGMTPMTLKLPYKSGQEVTVKADGYRTMPIVLETTKNYDRFMSVKATESFKSNLTSSDITGLIIEVPILSVLGTITDPTILFTGAYIEYVPKAYYVELQSEAKDSLTKDETKTLKVKEYILKNHSALALEDKEYVKSLSEMTNLDAKELINLGKIVVDPVGYAEDVVTLMQKSGK